MDNIIEVVKVPSNVSFFSNLSPASRAKSTRIIREGWAKRSAARATTPEAPQVVHSTVETAERLIAIGTEMLTLIEASKGDPCGEMSRRLDNCETLIEPLTSQEDFYEFDSAYISEEYAADLAEQAAN